jgi:hypothetical protein
MMQTVELVLSEDAETLPEVVAGFTSILSSGQAFTVDIPLPSVGSSNSYLDLAADFIDASLIAERLGAGASRRSMSWATVGHASVVRLELDGYDPKLMSLDLASIAAFISFPNQQAELLRDEYEELVEARYVHEEAMEQAQLLFPEIADHYLGNLLMSYGEWDEPEVLREHLQRHPERRYGFFIMKSVRPQGLPVLSSDGELILPSEVSLDETLKSLGYGGEKPLPARLVMTEREANFIGDHVVLGVRADLVTQAIACGDDFVRRLQSQPGSYDLVSFQGRPAAFDDRPTSFVGELSGFAVLKCAGFTIVFFNAEPVFGQKRSVHADLLLSLGTSLHDGGAAGPARGLAWDDLDDELFEQLCWDYLYASPHFDRDRLEKVGKSRSRDGGRDIVAWTNRAAPFYRAPVKYIFQCKHIGADESLTPRHIRSIADVIEQYGAGGYGVMTCGYIDATLHDRIDAIGVSRKVDVRKLDRFQLERFVCARPRLMDKYFKAKGHSQT